MEITIERYKATSLYTLSHFYETTGSRHFLLDLLEPPLSAFAQPSDVCSVNPGTYKLFLKSDNERCELVPVLQKIYRGPRFCLVKPEAPIQLEQPCFVAPNLIAQASLWLGRVTDCGFMASDAAFDRFMISAIIAKQHRDTIHLHIINNLK